MTTDLLPVQAAALAAAHDHDRFGWWLEMGLGKSLAALFEFNQLFLASKVSAMIVICPNSIISTWKGEITKHGFPFNVVVKPDSIRHISPPCVILYNYESLIATAGKFIPDILANHKTYMVLDESIQIKNHRSARWKAIRSWEKDVCYMRLLSGRPMVQSAMDLWTQLTLLRACISNSPYAFRNRYCIMGGWQGKVITGIQNKEALIEITAQVSFTATKRDWTNLPDKLYTTREYEMTSNQKTLYKQMFDTMVAEITEDKAISVMHAVHKISKLQQVTSGFMIDEWGEAVPILGFESVPKVKLLDEIMEEASGKVIVFAHYRASVDALRKHYGCPAIIGGMKEEDIKTAIDDFNDGPCQVIVAQMAAAKYGLTLLGNDAIPCHTTVYFENTYSLDARIQSEDRNHRHGQKVNVLYIDLVGAQVERKIIAALQRKDQLSLEIMGITK